MATYGSVSNFNAIETSSSVTVGGNLVCTGTFKLIDAIEAVSGSTTLASTADLDNVSYQTAKSTEGTLKKYLLATPVAGARKEILFSCATATTSVVYVYASASSAVTAYFGAATSDNILTGYGSNILVSLLGNSTAQWLVTSISTLNNLSTGTVSIASTNT